MIWTTDFSGPAPSGNKVPCGGGKGADEEGGVAGAAGGVNGLAGAAGVTAGGTAPGTGAPLPPDGLPGGASASVLAAGRGREASAKQVTPMPR